MAGDHQAMKQDKGKFFLPKLFSYLFLPGQRDAQWKIRVSPKPTHRRRSSPEEREEQKRQYRRFLLWQTLGS